jgi:rubrerythrin
MSAARLNVHTLTRIFVNGEEESLQFEPGVNVLVGPPNTGKSGWLRTLDFLFGDDAKVEDALGTRIAPLYRGARATLTINGRELTLERRWGAGDVRGKVYVDGLPIEHGEFSDDFLPRLGLPVLRVPSGDPFGPRKWPRLAWRTLYRHIYRHENSWDDIASKQPDSEQHACIALFLGVAERLFPPEYGQLVQKQRDLDAFQARRDQFVASLQDVARELVAIREASVELSSDSISTARERLSSEIAALETDRQELLQALQAEAQQRIEAADEERRKAFAGIGERLATLRAQRETAAEKLAEGNQRRRDLEQQQRLLRDELEKLQRASASHEVLADLRITHCPNCDQRVTRNVAPDTCRLCLQSYPQHDDDGSATDQRLAFEIQQITAEIRELDELLHEIGQERELESRAMRDLDDEIRRIDNELRPSRTAAAWILPPELSALDQERGRLGEQLRQLDRIELALARHGELSDQIADMDRQIEELRSEVKAKIRSVDLTDRGRILATGMNNYLNALNAGEGSRRWVAGQVGVRLRDRDANFTLGGGNWRREVGGTLTCFFLAAYNYALLRLSAIANAAYPGFSVIDLPPNLSDNRVLTDEENYLVEPFVRMLSQKQMAGTQLIITGHAYEGLEGVNRIQLSKVFAPPTNA